MNTQKIIMTKKAIVGLSLTQKFKKMCSPEIVPLLKQKKQLYAKINKFDAKRSELDAEIFWKFDKFEKENDCKVEWKDFDYDFKLENLEVKSNKEIEEKKAEVPKERIIDGHTYKLIS